MAEPVKIAKVRARERVVVDVDRPAARWIGSLAVLSLFCWLVVLLARNHDHADWNAAGRLAWSLTILTGVALIARGIFLGRPVTAAHATSAMSVLVVGLGAHLLSYDLVGNVLVAGAGLVLMWPTTARPQPEELPRVWSLVNATQGDPLAPFALQSLKSYYFNEDGTAAIAYRTRVGFATVSGDPIGDETQFPQLVADFVAMCHTRGWRLIVLGCSERRLALWRNDAVVGQRMRRVPIGRDVVIDVRTFDMVGRKYRNLRQAVQRTHNFGITTEVVAEQDIDDALRAELAQVLFASQSGAHTERGFSMILDGALERRYPGIELIVARDRNGQVQGFHRYATAGGGRDITLDVPWRRPGAPNGIDERLTVDMIYEAKAVGSQRLSLAFAAFPEVFNNKNRNWLQDLTYHAIHLLDSLIALESLYRYLRKFHALG
ncbi:MAG TPA: phosphatidylglycerol lysyltransferase domain-containing protein, partial [Mycobacterium sp.]|nr:phosphatidylglycerol lysyltransferase domain-containing protein [Mycobacterium sp.]